MGRSRGVPNVFGRNLLVPMSIGQFFLCDFGLFVTRSLELVITSVNPSGAMGLYPPSPLLISIGIIC